MIVVLLEVHFLAVLLLHIALTSVIVSSHSQNYHAMGINVGSATSNCIADSFALPNPPPPPSTREMYGPAMNTAFSPERRLIWLMTMHIAKLLHMLTMHELLFLNVMLFKNFNMLMGPCRNPHVGVLGYRPPKAI